MKFQYLEGLLVLDIVTCSLEDVLLFLLDFSFKQFFLFKASERYKMEPSNERNDVKTFTKAQNDASKTGRDGRRNFEM